MSDNDPVTSNPEHYKVVFENDHVRVLDYSDSPGEQTTMHSHPNSVMVTLSAFHRRLHTPGGEPTVALEAGKAMWLPAQQHRGENIGATPTRVIFVELKGPAVGTADAHVVGPDTP